MRSMTIFVALGFLAILASLATALFFMMRTGKNNRERGRRMAWALTARIALSVALFLCVLLAWKLGYIRPTGLPLR